MKSLLTLPFLAMALSACQHAGLPANQQKNNIVFILADDLGWMDLECYGSTFYETPAIDRMAARGVRFTQAYSAHPTCSPTRASIMTGKYPSRLHITSFIPGVRRPYARMKAPENWSKYLKMSETSYAEMLGDHGYLTFHAGKWHMGQLGPEYHGFDQVIPNDYNPDRPDDPKNCDYYTDKTIEFIEAHSDTTFIAVISHNTVHVPLGAPAELVEKYHDKPPGENGQNNATMAAMIEQLDHSVARVYEALERLQLLKNTYVVFFSDNGGLSMLEGKIATSNLPLRSGKSQCYEGGIRVPFLVTGPGIEGNRTIDVPVISNDLFPTFSAMGGIQDCPDTDGLNLLPLIKGKESGLDRTDLFWYYPHYQTLPPHGAVRSGDWKLIEHYEPGRVELFNLAEDLSESQDLSGEYPDKVSELKSLFDGHLARVGGQKPAMNPGYDPDKDGRDSESYGPHDPGELSQPEYLKIKDQQ